MTFSYLNSITCVRSDNLDWSEQALTRNFEQEGCRRIPQPPLPPNLLPITEERLWLFKDIQPYLWAICLFKCRLGWTIIKTSPSGLLCPRARGASRPRLSELAMQIGCDAFHHSVHELYCGALLEADAAGRTFVSGDLLDYDDVEQMKFYDEPVTKRTGGPHFYLLNVPENIRVAASVRIDYEEQRRRRQELEVLSQQGGEQARAARIEREQLFKGSFEVADQALMQVFLCPIHYWYTIYEGYLLYKAYTEPQQLAADGTRLLYFQPEKSYRKRDAGEIWQAISKGINTATRPFTRPVHYQQPRAGEIKDVTTRGAVMDDEDDEFDLNELPF